MKARKARNFANLKTSKLDEIPLTLLSNGALNIVYPLYKRSKYRSAFSVKYNQNVYQFEIKNEIYIREKSVRTNFSLFQ